MRNASLNDADREEWISNDEGLLAWKRSTRLGMRAFIRANRAELDEYIKSVRDAPPPERTWRDYA